jgi:hypothetical protein
MVSIFALFVSILSVVYSVIYSKKNIRFGIQESIFKTVSEKARNCNYLWDAEPRIEKENPNSPHFKIMSELIITKEIIEKSFELFGKNELPIKNNKDDYYYLFWKQLNTDLRGWISRTPEIAKGLKNEYYTKQVVDLFEKVQKHFP